LADAVSRPESIQPEVEVIAIGALIPVLLNLAAADDPSTELARRIHEKAGGDELATIAEIRFKLVVYQTGTKAFEAEHRWDLRNQRDHVVWIDRNGVRMDGVVDLRTRQARGVIAGRVMNEGVRRELSEKAYARWVNDAYWLMLPLKLLDPGVIRKLEAPRVVKGKKYDVLKLSFDKVGLTPGDEYYLYIDPETGDIQHWVMELEGAKASPEGTTFENYRKIGPLRLPLDHASDDGREKVNLEDVKVLTAVDEDDFRIATL
jgi:uncharacterized protein DUF6503